MIVRILIVIKAASYGFQTLWDANKTFQKGQFQLFSEAKLMLLNICRMDAWNDFENFSLSTTQSFCKGQKQKKKRRGSMLQKKLS